MHKCTYRWTPEQRRKLLDRGTEHKDNLDTPQDVPQHTEARPQTIFQDTSADLGPRKLITISTQTKHAYVHPKRPRHQFKYRGHHQTRHKSSITRKGWSPRQGPTLSRINFLCKVILPHRTNLPRLTATLKLRNTTLRIRLQSPTTPAPHEVYEYLPPLDYQVALELRQARNHAKALLTNMAQDYKSILQEVTNHENHHTSENQVITTGMGKRSPGRTRCKIYQRTSTTSQLRLPHKTQHAKTST